ncbi:MAG: class I SAM-dependent methyltransferase [Candidatus Hermodarchaeota archaeon]
MKKKEKREEFIKILNQDPLALEEAERLNYYDLLAFLTTHIVGAGGTNATLKLGKMCNLDGNKKVLMIGSGTGLGSLILAKEYGCSVIGIDISEIMVKRSKAFLNLEGLKDKVDFRIGDARKLEFDDGTFDVVLMEYVVQFFDKDAFEEFKRVLKPEGIIGLNEVAIDDETPLEVLDKIEEIRTIFSDLTGFNFRMRSVSEWNVLLRDARLSEVHMEINKPEITLKEAFSNLGGFRVLLNIVGKMRKYLKSPIIKEKIMKQKEAKHLMRKKATKKYIGIALITGKK